MNLEAWTHETQHSGFIVKTSVHKLSGVCLERKMYEMSESSYDPVFFLI